MVGETWKMSDNDNVCPKCGHSGEYHILQQWEYFLCFYGGCDCKTEWKTSWNK